MPLLNRAGELLLLLHPCPQSWHESITAPHTFICHKSGRQILAIGIILLLSGTPHHLALGFVCSNGSGLLGHCCFLKRACIHDRRAAQHSSLCGGLRQELQEQ